MSVLFGVYLDNRPTDQQEVDYLIEALQAYPNAKIEGVVVGNEVMYRNTLHKQTLIQRIHEVRGKVRAVGYATGNPSYQTAPVYAVEIFPIPEIGGASDMLGLNIHPFYRPDLQNHPDPEIMSDRILKAAVEQIELYQSLMPNKPIIVTEIGWPTHSDASELHRGDPIVALKFMKVRSTLTSLHRLPLRGSVCIVPEIHSVQSAKSNSLLLLRTLRFAMEESDVPEQPKHYV